METHQLNTSWTLWFHKYNDDKWGIDSYTKLCSINTIEDYLVTLNVLKPKYIQNGMFFFMRNEIEPMWEAEENKDGGCFSFKIYKQDLAETWKTLTTKLINESLLKNDDNHLLVNGLSISPKKTYSIIKLWIKGDTINDIKEINDIDVLKESTPIYKKHK